MVDVIVLGAGAAGLMCAIEAAKRGRKVLILEKSNKPGKKILMSGGGRCNFTNMYASPENYISHNPHFCKSALSRYTPWDFIALVQSYGIRYYEKKLGQLFCHNKSSDILEMLLSECAKHKVEIRLNQSIESIVKDHCFKIKCQGQVLNCQSLVVATGGLSIPTLGSSPFGFELAKQFGLNVYSTRAGLVPFTLGPEDKQKYQALSGISLDASVSFQSQTFNENILFTHRGISGPAILQISSYWQASEPIKMDLSPVTDLLTYLKNAQQNNPETHVKTLLSEHFPKKFLSVFFEAQILDTPVKRLTESMLNQVIENLKNFEIKPCGTEGYRTAEVTLGGVNCDGLSSKTMEAKKVAGLYFVGEVIDVTGWLGGYNFQWAWSSGWAAGQVV